MLLFQDDRIDDIRKFGTELVTKNFHPEEKNEQLISNTHDIMAIYTLERSLFTIAKIINNKRLNPVSRKTSV